MNSLQKIESGLGRTIETIGGLAFLDNFANEAASKRIASETKYLNGQVKPTTSDDVTKAQDTVQDATKTTATGISAQIKQMDAQNNLLTQMKVLAERQVELGEKTLVALTLTDAEKRDSNKTSNLRRDNKFASSYAYV